MKQNMKKIFIGCTMLVLVLLLGVAGWLIFGKNKPTEETQIAKNELGVEWYDVNEKEFTITTVEQFYEFAQLSVYHDFAGQTIYLGADLVLNEGDAKDWADFKSEPKNKWESIFGFKGTFDGQGHTISGVYSIGYLYSNPKGRLPSMDYVTAGLFRNTQKECIIKNFKLVNSFFDSDLNKGGGCISGYGGGTFDTIYTDAIVVTQKNHVGGILGGATLDTTIRNCWFDGSIEVVGGYGRFVGGILGRSLSNAKVTIEHCLVSADMSSDLYERGVNMGGIVGQTQDSTVTIKDCLASGRLYNEWYIVGSVVGNIDQGSDVTMSDVFATADTWTQTVGHAGGTRKGTPVKYEREKITGYGGYQWTTLDFENYWAVVEGGTPVLKSFATDTLSLDGIAKMIDVSWYNETENTFVLNDREDLFGFVLLSYTTDFKDKTVKLGADITVNEGKASTWNKTAPELEWMTIGSSAQLFQGTFDGQMHTISGVYLKTDETYSGLFGMTGNSAVLKNFRLENSYFETSAPSVGSIAGRGVGTYDTIYSNAIVRSSNGNVGGIVGQVTSAEATDKLSLNNCWFDGSIKTTENKIECSKVGGMVGFAIIEVNISNCLNTGTIDASIYTVPNSETSKHVQPYVGGFVGQIHPKGKLIMTSCLNVGDVKHSDKATTSFGSIIGTASGPAEISHVYATKESCKRTMNGYITGQTIAYNKEQLVGYGGYKWTTLNFQKYWAVVENDTSILKSFAKKVPSVNGVARMIDTSWYDKKADTYTLYDAADFYGFALMSYTDNFAGKTVKLGADITLNTGNASDWASKVPECGWIGISSFALPFEGTFDGQMHTISGVYMKTETSYSGLFCNVAYTATLKNFSLKNSYFESSAANFGSIAGRGLGKYDTIYSNAIVVGAAGSVAGMVGQVTADEASENAKLTMTNCWFDGSVTNTSKTNQRTGGLLGFVVVDANVSNCLNTGTIDSTAYQGTPFVGGLIAHVYKKSNVTISDCLNAGEVKYNKSAGSGYGSVIGGAEGSTNVANTFTTAESCKKAYAGKINGQILIYSEQKLSGYGGYQWTTLDFDKYWAAVPNDTSVLKSFATDALSLNGVVRMIDTSWYDKNASSYTLYDAADLYGFAIVSYTDNFAGKTVKLGADIVVNTGNAADWAENAPQYDWSPIGTSGLPFAGTFDGGMHSISGIYLDSTDNYVGLFAAVVTAKGSKTASVKNLKLVNSYIHTTGGTTGGIAGLGDGEFNTIYSDAIVVATKAGIGGLIGGSTSDDGVTLKNCWFGGSVTQVDPTSENHRGTAGLIGIVYDYICMEDCLNTGTIDSNYDKKDKNGNIMAFVGGLVGAFDNAKGKMKLVNCLNAGSITVSEKITHFVGPIVGALNEKVNKDCSGVYAVSGSCNRTRNERTGCSYVEKAAITGKASLDTLAGFNADNWEALHVDIPVLKAFVDEVDMIDTSWYVGHENDAKYVLTTREQLYGLAELSQTNNFKNKTIELGADIVINTGDRTDWATTAPEYMWQPIGSSTLPFAGTFDGGMHTISGICVSTGKAYSGLFAAVATAEGSTTATVKNLKLLNSYFNSRSGTIGSIAGLGDGEFNNIYSDAVIVAKSAGIGGLIGGSITNSGVTLKKCWFDGTVTQVNPTEASHRGTGGLIGIVYDYIRLEDCLNTGIVDSSMYAIHQGGGVYAPYTGGLVGWFKNAGILTIVNCLNAGNVIVNNVTTHFTGPIVGANAATPTNCSGVYAIKGCCSKIRNHMSYTEVDRIAITGVNALSKLSGFSADNWEVKEAAIPVIKDFADIMTDTSWYVGHEAEDTYVLYTRADLYDFVALSQTYNFTGKTIKLGADIYVHPGEASKWTSNAPDVTWTPIAKSTAFAGTFDGSDPVTKEIHTISGIYLHDTTTQRNGLFGYVTGGTIKNLRLENSYFYTSTQKLGSIVGELGTANVTATLDTVYSDAIVTNTNAASAGVFVGGLVGVVGNSGSADVDIKNCWYDGTVTNDNSAYCLGGLVGLSLVKTLDVQNCMFTGLVVSSKATSGAGKGAGSIVGNHWQGKLSIKNIVVDPAEGYNIFANLIVGYGSPSNISVEKLYWDMSGTPYYSSVMSPAAGESIQIKTDTDYSVLLNSDNCWTAVEGSYPVLSSFAE